MKDNGGVLGYLSQDIKGLLGNKTVPILSLDCQGIRNDLNNINEREDGVHESRVDFLKTGADPGFHGCIYLILLGNDRNIFYIWNLLEGLANPWIL